MKSFAIFAVLFVAASAAEKSCSKEVNRVCNPKNSKYTADLNNCNAKYGAIDTVLPDLQKYARIHLRRSFEYLLMATHYGNYEKNRAGFEKLYRSLSDETWHDSIELIKYIGKRGGSMNFSGGDVDRAPGDKQIYELHELESLAKALDIQKQLAEEANKIHSAVSHIRPDEHDAEVMSYIEEEFAEKYSKTVRDLAGHVVDLHELLDGPDSSIALFLFDDYLAKK